MERIAKDTYDGKLKRGDLDSAHIQKTYDELTNAAIDGDKNWLKVAKSTGAPSLTSLKMQQNLYWFSGAKDYTMLTDLNTRLVKDGKIQNWSAFKKQALELNKTYNENYLKREWKTSKQSALMAQNWSEYVRNQDTYKNLKYKTQEDNLVREAHVLLNNIIKPVNDPWWKTHYPPNGYGPCRCYVIQTNEAATSEQDTPILNNKDFPPEFRTNVGETGQTFKESTANGGKPHPFIQLAKDTPGVEKNVNKLFFKLNQTRAVKILVDKTTKHSELSNEITFNATSIRHAFNQPHKNYAIKNQILPFINTVITKAEYLGFSTYKKNDAFSGAHIFKTIINDDESYIIVRETWGGKLIFYSISDSKKVAIDAKK